MWDTNACKKNKKTFLFCPFAYNITMLCNLVDSVAHNSLQIKTKQIYIIEMENSKHGAFFHYLFFYESHIVCVVSRRIHLCVKWKNDSSLALHWFHPGLDSFPIFIVAAFSLLAVWVVLSSV